MKLNNLSCIVCGLSALMLFQSCVVYHKTPVSVDEAIATNEKVKIYTTENKKYKFDKILREESNIYGISSIHGNSLQKFAPSLKEIQEDKGVVKILLPFEIKEVYIQNKKGSTMATIATVLVPLLLISAMAVSGLQNANFGPGG